MSDALRYLLAARPDAMGAYFGFLKDAGSRLDPRTRALISVITKVANQTEPGLRQYLPKALDAGVSAEEVIDALLMAFPALGLSKIVWAIDVILDMDLPEFALQPDPQSSWRRLGAGTEFAEGSAHCVEVGGRTLLVIRTAAGYSVFDARCPHQGTPLCGQAIEDGRIRCPRHGWTFDADSGAAVGPGDRPLRAYPHKQEDGALWVRY